MMDAVFPVPILREKTFFVLNVVHKTFRQKAQQTLHKHFDITLEMLCALTVIQQAQPLNQQALADLVISERSAAKRLVDNMIKRQLVIAGTSAGNRRHRMLSLTRHGEQVAAGAGQLMDEIEAEFLQVLTDEEQSTLLNLSHKLLQANLGESGTS